MENVLNAIEQMKNLIEDFTVVLKGAGECAVAGEKFLDAAERLDKILKGCHLDTSGWEAELAAIKSGIDGKEKKLLQLMKDVRQWLANEHAARVAAAAIGLNPNTIGSGQMF